MKYLNGAYASHCHSWTDEEWRDSAAVWSDIFSDVPVNTVFSAIKRYIAEDGGQFFPSATSIYGIVKSVKDPLSADELDRLLGFPKTTDGSCPYGFCDGSGYVKWQKSKYGVPYDMIETCPCQWNKHIEAAISDGQTNRLGRLESERSLHKKRLETLKGEHYLREYPVPITPDDTDPLAAL
jgi:hypothetical protein